MTMMNSREKVFISEPIQVFCRVRPVINSSERNCLNVVPPCEIHLTQPQTPSRHGKNIKYTFKEVFEEDSKQKAVFDLVALPLVQNLLVGKSGLLLAYGVTGSGKTYTMTGNGENPGIMPRCLDVIFNSIYEYQAKKYVFKPDKLNGFELQSDADAKLDRDHALLSHISQNKGSRQKVDKLNSDPDLLGRSRDSSRVNFIDEDNHYAVFVTYVEVYNNNVYDLLEDLYSDASRPKPLQAKIVREDSSHNMYVHGVTEVEIGSTEEAFEVFYKGQKRKHIAQTTLNTESSRAHTVFNIRVVQAPTDENGETLLLDKKQIIVSQLSLVDLAGSERSVRTKNTGQRLREAGNINNSLLTLRTCLEILKENQNGANKMIPYRESRLTHLFKNYFDGQGQVTMIICVSPSFEDFDETLHVLKFAEMSQEIQMACPTVIPSVGYTPGRRKANQAFKAALLEYNTIKKDPLPLIVETASITHEVKPDLENNPENVANEEAFHNLPILDFVQMDDDVTLKNAVSYLKDNSKLYSSNVNGLNERYQAFRDSLLKSERDTFMATQELKSLSSLLEIEKNKVTDLEKKLHHTTQEMNSMKRKFDESDLTIKRLRREVSQKNLEINEMKIERENLIEIYNNQIAEKDQKMNNELHSKLSSQKSAFAMELRRKKEKLRRVKKILDTDTESLFSVASSSDMPAPSAAPNSPPSKNNATEISRPIATPPSNLHAIAGGPVRSTARKLGFPVSNKRHRRSRSADVWLDHRPAIAVPLGTVMQPKMCKKKSVSKLTQAKDITEGTSKYCLMTQGQDSDGDLETRLYKGDVIPTLGGGAQVMFNDIEVLKQMSPSRSPSTSKPVN
ncbi:kinesin-like protein KIF23 [Halyomorpha halys]|uniref:kinesin-like protein KIF23 n=1 Tax=Halyomorpha halys TaxID=286706 RepID=UPI0006D50604|nr:kinesin-like protein KIF23 [Halyomorpha halys]